jgi:competence protein ComEA
VAGVTTGIPGLTSDTHSNPSPTAQVPTADPNAKINVNTATAKELDVLPGVGPVTAQKIIDNRPYAKLEELKEKKAVNKSTYEKIKDKVTL